MPATHVEQTGSLRPALTSLLSLSDLAQEGIANRGSFRFADHLYRNEPSGRRVVGHYLDALFLQLPAARAFRRRYLCARDALRAGVTSAGGTGPIRILTVPCGIPRDVVEMAMTLERVDPALVRRFVYVGMDIDPEALRVAAQFADGGPLNSSFHQGDALRREQYPAGRFHVASSTGLGEFLDDAQLGQLFRNVYDVLEPGGVFFTSATASDPLSALLLRIIDLETRYRPKPHLEAVLGVVPWRSVDYVLDPTGLQTFATAVK